MLKSPYSNRKKPKNPREIYNEKVGRGRGETKKHFFFNEEEKFSLKGLSVYADRKRKSMTHLKSMDDADIAYRSTSHYLRSVTAESEPDEPTDLQLIKSIPRTQSANELAEKGFRKKKYSKTFTVFQIGLFVKLRNQILEIPNSKLSKIITMKFAI